LNKAFNFDEKEFFTSSVFLSSSLDENVAKVDLSLPTIDACGVFEKNEVIENAYKESLNFQNQKEQILEPRLSFEKNFYKQTILNRRSSRDFFKKSISKVEFEAIMDILNQAITSDFDEELNLYCVINRVKEMPLGVIKDGKYIKKR
jgi:hypothetical protein